MNFVSFKPGSVSIPVIGVVGQTQVTVRFRDYTDTEELITSVAILLKVSTDRIILSLNFEAQFPNNHTTTAFGLEKAKEFDALMKSQFNSKIENFLHQGKITRVLVKRDLPIT